MFPIGGFSLFYCSCSISRSSHQEKIFFPMRIEFVEELFFLGGYSIKIACINMT